MSGHKRDDLSRGTGRGGDEFAHRVSTTPPSAGRYAPRTLKPIFWVAAVVGLIVWSTVALIGYVSVDSLLGWAAANAGLAVDSGKKLVTAVGVGKEAVGVVDGLNVGGFLEQAISVLRVVAKPAIVVLWAIGAVALIAAPFILSKIGQRLPARRY